MTTLGQIGHPEGEKCVGVTVSRGGFECLDPPSEL